MLSLLAVDTAPKWLLILYIYPGEPELIKDSTKDINCQKIEQPTHSLKHCQNTQTLTPVRISPPYFLSKSKCVEIIKEKNPNVG